MENEKKGLALHWSDNRITAGSGMLGQVLNTGGMNLQLIGFNPLEPSLSIS